MDLVLRCTGLLAVLLLLRGIGVPCVASAGEAGAATGALPALRFSAIPDQDETRLREKFAPVARYLEAELGVPVQYIHATRYSDSVDLFKNGDIMLAWFGGLTGVQARHAVKGARAIAQGVEDPEFYSYFIARTDTGIERTDEFPTQLGGMKFSFGSMGSTSGRLMPEHYIRANTGKDPRDFFSAVSFSGSHDRTAELVESGQLQAGAINYKVYDRRVAEGRTDPNVVRVIWKTPSYPDYNFTAHPDLERVYGAGFTDKLQSALLAMKDPDLLSAFPRTGMVAADNADFEAIHKLARPLEFIR